jgi:hypothetical protein
MTDTVIATRPVTQEACDRCGARARVLATLPSGGELAFCGHHDRAFREPLRAAGAWSRPVG